MPVHSLFICLVQVVDVSLEVAGLGAFSGQLLLQLVEVATQLASTGIRALSLLLKFFY